MARRCELTGIAVQSGNKVSHSNRKTRTRFLPNLVQVTLVSDLLERSVRLRVTAAALAFGRASRRPRRFPRQGPRVRSFPQDAVKLKREIAKKRAEVEGRSREAAP